MLLLRERSLRFTNSMACVGVRIVEFKARVEAEDEDEYPNQGSWLDSRFRRCGNLVEGTVVRSPEPSCPGSFVDISTLVPTAREAGGLFLQVAEIQIERLVTPVDGGRQPGQHRYR